MNPLLLIYTVFTCTLCSFIDTAYTSHSPGEITPQNVAIGVGDSVNITCHINLQILVGRNSSSLYFEYWDTRKRMPEEDDAKKRVPEEDVAIVNEDTIVYMLRNAPLQKRNYVCKSDQDAIGITFVSVGTRPLDVEDFRCRGFDYTYMVCNFTKPDNNIETPYNLSYFAQNPNYLQVCDVELINNKYYICNLTLDNGNYRRGYKFYNFTLTGHNVLGSNPQKFWINHYESVIPPRPDCRIMEIGTNSVVLSWQLDKYSYYRGLQYQLLLRLSNSDVWQPHDNYEVTNSKSEYNLTLKELPYAYFNYTISLRLKVKTERQDDSLWSEQYVNSFRTSACPPDEPPLTDVGSFYIDSTATRVRLYWQQLPVYYENGPNFKYVVTQVKRKGEIIKLDPIHIDRTSAVFAWDKYDHYEFSIKSQNDEGLSPKHSIIRVPPLAPTSKVPRWIRNVYHAPNHTYTLSWTAPGNQRNLLDYTVFWCQPKRAKPNECEGSISFKHLSKQTTYYNTVPQQYERTLNLAVSANYDDTNSGMYWAMCTADFSSDLIKLEPEITTSARFIEIQWSVDRVCTSLLEGYNLTYCRVESVQNVTVDALKCLDGNTTITIDKMAKKYFLLNLQPYTSYKVEMFMYSQKKIGKVSDAQVVKTREEASSPPRSLKFRNVTSNSAWISWLPPTQLNGRLRYYTVVYNNEHHIVNVTTDRQNNSFSNETEQEVSFKLENLSSFTNYKVYIVAHTVDASSPSNDVHFKTLIGVPSSPRQVEYSGHTHTLLQWSPPEVPSGRVEYYEVSVMIWYKDEIKRQRISAVVGSRSCVLDAPLCIDRDYKQTLQVRAVNVATRSNSEIDHHLYAGNSTTDEDPDAAYYSGNDDLKCVGTTLSDVEQAEAIERWRNSKDRVLYKSVWEMGPTYHCGAQASIIWWMVLLVFLMVLMMAFLGDVAYKKYNKMASIDCVLPPELMAGPFVSKGAGVDNGFIEKEEEDIHRSKESLYNNEKHRLLSSVYNDSGYLGGGVTGVIMGTTPHSIGKSSGYIGSDHSSDYVQHDNFAAGRGEQKTPAAADNAYMVMEVIKPSVPSSAYEMTSTSGAGSNGYVLPSAPTDWDATTKPQPRQVVSPQKPFIPSDNGYIKPHKILKWQHELSAANAPYTIADTHVDTGSGSSGYVAPQNLLQKPTVQPSYDGYTTLDALGKPLSPPSSQFTSPAHTIPPPISGYVTQKELSAYGQHNLS